MAGTSPSRGWTGGVDCNLATKVVRLTTGLHVPSSDIVWLVKLPLFSHTQIKAIVLLIPSYIASHALKSFSGFTMFHPRGPGATMPGLGRAAQPPPARSVNGRLAVAVTAVNLTPGNGTAPRQREYPHPIDING